MSSLAWFLQAVVVLLIVLCFVSESSASSNDDKITSLPGQPPVKFNQYAGYVEVENNKSLFYYFVEAETSPQTKPLVLWLNGGPGCSSLLGAFDGHGPFKPNGQFLVKNNFSWNQEANMLFLESPAGVGFSISSNNASFTNDEITAQDNLKFLFGWLEKFPEYKNKDLFLTGVSYAGHYIPQLANLVLESRLKSNLKGVALANPLLDFDNDYNTKADFFWSHGLISDSTFSMANSLCNISQIFKQFMQPQGNLSDACSKVYTQGIAEIGNFVNTNNVLIDICNPQLGGSGADVCLGNEIYKYLNNKDVQEALHAKLVGVKEWTPCTSDIDYVEQDGLLSTLPLVGKLVKSGIQVMIYSGDQDATITFMGTRRLVNILAEVLGLNTTMPYTSWLHNKQVGGWTQVYGNILSFATVRGGGHDSSTEQPERALAVFISFLQGKPLPAAPLS